MANLYRLEKLKDSYPHLVSDIVTYTPEGLEFETTTDPVIDPTLLSEVKTILTAYDTERDDMLRGFIKSATKKIENFIHRSIVTQEITAYWRIAYGHVFLPRPPHISITSVKEIDDDGTETTLTSSDYNTFGQNEFVLEFDSSINNQLEIVYQSGYGQLRNDLPQDLVDAIKFQVEYYYVRTNRSVEIPYDPKIGLTERSIGLASDYIYNYPGD